jgi:hypothetical protein
MRNSSADEKQIVSACTSGNTSLLRKLLASGTSPNAEARGHSALHAAIASGAGECAQLLIEAKADLDNAIHSDAAGLKLTPLMLACCEGLDAMAELLLRSAGSDVSRVLAYPEQTPRSVGNPMTPLMLACLWAQPGCVRVLLKYDVSTEEEIEGPPLMEGDTALDMALKRSVVLGAGVGAEEVTEDVSGRARECAHLILSKRRALNPSGFSEAHVGMLFKFCDEVGLHASHRLGAHCEQCEGRARILGDIYHPKRPSDDPSNGAGVNLCTKHYHALDERAQRSFTRVCPPMEHDERKVRADTSKRNALTPLGPPTPSPRAHHLPALTAPLTEACACYVVMLCYAH